MSFPKISRIIKTIRRFEPEAIVRLHREAGTAVQIKGLRKYDEARKGDLSWIAENVLYSWDASEYSGSMLICPRNAGTRADSAHATLVFSANPRLLFAKIAGVFFTDMTHIAWDGRNTVVAKDAVIGKNVTLASGAVIGPSVMLSDDVRIGPNTVLANCRIGSHTFIGANCTIGLPGFGLVKDADGSYIPFPHVGRVLIGRNVSIGSNTCIDRGGLGDTVIGDGVKIDNLVHIAHNVVIGENSVIIANTMIGGSTVIGKNTWVAPSASLLNKIHVGENALIGMGAVVLKDVKKNSVVVGNPGRIIRKNK